MVNRQAGASPSRLARRPTFNAISQVGGKAYVCFSHQENGTGSPVRTDSTTPFDYAGTAGGGNANPTVYSSAGSKVITAKVFYTDGTQTMKTATFTVVA